MSTPVVINSFIIIAVGYLANAVQSMHAHKAVSPWVSTFAGFLANLVINPVTGAVFAPTFEGSVVAMALGFTGGFFFRQAFDAGLTSKK